MVIDFMKNKNGLMSLSCVLRNLLRGKGPAAACYLIKVNASLRTHKINIGT